MNETWLLVATGAGSLLFIAATAMLLQVIVYQQRLARRVQLVRGLAPVAVQTRQQMLHGLWARILAVLGQLILRTGLLSARTLAELAVTLESSGLRGRTGLEVFVGGKIGLLIALPSLAALVLRGMQMSLVLTVAIPAFTAVAGMLLPDIVVRSRRRRYIQRVERGLPDALDLLVICTQAGLGLTAAIVRVAEDMQDGRQDIGVELALTANELQVVDNRVALEHLGSRTGIEGLVRLANTLLQSMQYGTPLSEAMRVLSAEMRTDALTRFEARAARLGVLLTLPMIVFILPCVFLVVGGPAAIQVLRGGQ